MRGWLFVDAEETEFFVIIALFGRDGVGKRALVDIVIEEERRLAAERIGVVVGSFRSGRFSAVRDDCGDFEREVVFLGLVRVDCLGVEVARSGGGAGDIGFFFPLLTATTLEVSILGARSGWWSTGFRAPLGGIWSATE